MDLIEHLGRRNNDPRFNYADKQWRQFVYDHKNELMVFSEKRKITKDEMFVYKYDLNRYLRSIQYPTQAAWIVHYINDIYTDIAFVGIGLIMLPDLTKLDEYHNLYLSTKGQSV